jgi:hypothetical protein
MMELQFNGCYAATVDIVLVWKMARGMGKNHHKKRLNCLNMSQLSQRSH